MHFKWKSLKPRDLLTVGAEIATILTLILTWIMYKQAKNSETKTLIINPILILIIVVNCLLLLFFTISLIRSVFTRFHQKSYILGKKFEEFIASEPKYLLDLRGRDKEAEQKLLEKTKKALKGLDDNKAFDQDVYYMLLYTLFQTAQKNINVVSILAENEWVDTPEEDEFLRINLSVSEHKVHLNRIFVVNQKDVKEKLNTKSIKSFFAADRAYIHLFVVFVEKLTRNQINDIPSGFIVFDNFAVACDIFSDNEIRGTLKFDEKEIEFYNKTYMRLNEYFLPINKEFIDNFLESQENS